MARIENIIFDLQPSHYPGDDIAVSPSGDVTQPLSDVMMGDDGWPEYGPATPKRRLPLIEIDPVQLAAWEGEGGHPGPAQ